MTIDEFDRLVQMGRNKLIAVYSFHTQEHSNMTQAQSAVYLTEQAIKLALISERAPIPGETLLSWAQSNKVPSWAVSAAVLTLFSEYQWEPDGEIQRCTLASVLYRYYGSVERVWNSVKVKDACTRDMLSEYLNLAHSSREKYLKSKK